MIQKTLKSLAILITVLVLGGFAALPAQAQIILDFNIETSTFRL